MNDNRPLPRMLRPLTQDQAETARRLSAANLRPKVPQKPMDIGLFSDVLDQLDLVEMFQDPTNGDDE